MPSNEFLFSLLQFVALVAPAMAILMQVLQGSGEVESPPFRFLEAGLVLIIIGGSVIMYQLILSIGNNTTFIGTLFIFGSLMFLASAIAWRTIPGTEEITLSVNSFKSLWHLSKAVASRVVAFSIPFIAAVITIYFSQEWLNRALNIGPIRSFEQLSPSWYFGIVLFLIALRVAFYLVEVGYLTQYSSDSFTESVQATILFFIIVPIFIAPLFLLSHITLFIFNAFINISPSHPIYIIPYLWTSFVIIVMFSTNFWGEREGEERLVVDSEE